MTSTCSPCIIFQNEEERKVFMFSHFWACESEFKSSQRSCAVLLLWIKIGFERNYRTRVENVLHMRIVMRNLRSLKFYLTIRKIFIKCWFNIWNWFLVGWSWNWNFPGQSWNFERLKLFPKPLTKPKIFNISFKSKKSFFNFF